MMKKRIFLFVYPFFVFIVLFFCFSVLFSCIWLDLNFDITSFQQVLFHLRAPLGEAGDYQVYHFVLINIFPAFFIALVLSFPKRIYFIIQKIMLFVFKILNPIFQFIYKEYPKLQFVILFTIAIISYYTAEHYLHLSGYWQSRNKISTLYENYYQDYDDSVLKNSDILKNNQPKQNLIVIFAESLTSALTSRTNPNGIGIHPESPFGNLTPYLGDVAAKHINFSHNNRVGGIFQTEGTSWTAAALVAYLCGIPLNVPYENLSIEKHFLKSAVCVPDIFNQAGYKQVFLGGSNFVFAGKKHFLENHHIQVKDLVYLSNEDQVAKTILNDAPQIRSWGIHDRILMNLAKKELKQLSLQKEPFVLYLLTLDTHMPPTNESCELFSSNIRNKDGLKWGKYEKAFNCSDEVIQSFIEYIENSSLKENTSIVILGDHEPHNFQIYSNNQRVPIYNVFINSLFEKELNNQNIQNIKNNKNNKNNFNDLIKNRKLTHFDMAPLLLESVGIPADSFGLGRNPFKQKSLLESHFSLKELNDEILLPNKKYDSFWQMPEK